MAAPAFIIVAEHRVCKKCQVSKPIEEFGTYTTKYQTAGRRFECKPCVAIRTKATGLARSYRRFKKAKCERCGFVPMHTCQLDVDHIDGDHENDDISNLQTLCANCHRLKTYLNKEIRRDRR